MELTDNKDQRDKLSREEGTGTIGKVHCCFTQGDQDIKNTVFGSGPQGGKEARHTDIWEESGPGENNNKCGSTGKQQSVPNV